MFKLINNNEPNYLKMFMLRDQHNHSTRFSQHAVIVLYLKYAGSDPFEYIALRL